MAEIVYPDDGNEANDQHRVESYQKNKELHFLQMRNNLRNSFMNYNQRRPLDGSTNKSRSNVGHAQAAQVDHGHAGCDAESHAGVRRAAGSDAGRSRLPEGLSRVHEHGAGIVDGVMQSKSRSNYKAGDNPQMKGYKTTDPNQYEL